MALFTVKPATVQKDVAATFTIDYAELATYSAVPAGYYKNTSNWKSVYVRMKHKFSNQKAMLQFELPSTSADLLLTDAARAGDWELDYLMIRDFDEGEVLLKRADIPNVGDIDFIARSAATHGDIYVPAGGDVTIPSGGKRQYGDFVVESGGILRLADGGGITEIEVLETCLINGTIFANNGEHSGGTWNSISVLGENLSHTVTQKAGGAGGEGEDQGPVVEFVQDPGFDNSPAGSWSRQQDGGAITQPTFSGSHTESFGYGPDKRIFQLLTGLTIGETYDIEANLNGRAGGDAGVKIRIDGTQLLEMNNGFNQVAFTATSTSHTLELFASAFSIGNAPQYVSDVSFQVQGYVAAAGGSGGASVDGNGGGGGRAYQFGALNGGNAQNTLAGLGAGQDDAAADEYGEDGADSLTASEAGNGGFRGAHGQALYLKARKIQGTGTINASGQKGGDGGDGAEYDSGGVLYGNGAGGGGAGGDGGAVWLRHKIGTPSLTINVAGGAAGSRGLGGFGSTEAGHGTAGSMGSTDTATFS